MNDSDEALIQEACELTAQIQFHHGKVVELGQRRKQVFMLLQRSGHSVTAIAKMVGVTQARISELLANAVFTPEKEDAGGK